MIPLLRTIKTELDDAIKEKISVCKQHPSTVGGVAGASDAGPDLPDRTVALIRGLDLILEHHECPIHIRASLDLQVHAYLDSSIDELMWLKKCKLLLTVPLSKYLRNVSPPKPDDGSYFEPSGSLRTWMKNRLMAFNRKNTHLWYSWFQAKRATLPLSDLTVKETYDKHCSTLTKEDKGCDKTIEAIFADRTFSRLLSETTAKISAILSGGSPFEELGASSSACFEQTRGSGGQLYELRARVGIDSEMLWGTHLERMEWRPFVHGRVRESNVTMEVRGHDGRQRWDCLRSLSAQQNVDELVSCTIQAVLEPNKVRVISKGEALPYYSMRPLQKAMHSSLRNMPCFRLIGRPFSATDIIDLRQKAETTWKWFSIDYSAATDGLSWKYSGAIFRCLISQLPKHQFALAMNVLGPHKLYYPTRDGKKEFRGVQRNGQLMGSVLSFPILCLANLGVYLLATKELQQGWTDDQRLQHVLVNGDDMVYAAPESLWEEHIALGKKVGLEMSIGKAYVHDTYLNINSISVHAPLAQPQVHPWRIDYLNVGLAFGQHKVQNRSDTVGVASEDDRKPEGYTCNINTILDGCLPGRQGMMMKWILRNKKDLLLQEASGHADELLKTVQDGRTHSAFFNRDNLGIRNIFLPVQIGGMGVLPPVGWRYTVTKNQACRAMEAILANSAKVSLQRPLPGYEIRAVDLDVNEPWMKTKSELAEPEDSARRNRREWLKYDLDSLCFDQRSDKRWIKTIPTLIRYDTSPNAWCR
jgi:hypothetical protein